MAIRIKVVKCLGITPLLVTGRNSWRAVWKAVRRRHCCERQLDRFGIRGQGRAGAAALRLSAKDEFPHRNIMTGVDRYFSSRERCREEDSGKSQVLILRALRSEAHRFAELRQTASEVGEKD